jgi:hypothetical protein
MKYFALAMSALYVLAGCALLFTPWLEEIIRSFRPPIGLLLLGYGVVRAYMWRRKFADQTDPE